MTSVGALLDWIVKRHSFRLLYQLLMRQLWEMNLKNLSPQPKTMLLRLARVMYPLIFPVKGGLSNVDPPMVKSSHDSFKQNVGESAKTWLWLLD